MAAWIVAVLAALTTSLCDAQFVTQYSVAVNSSAGIGIGSTCPPLVFGSGGAILCWSYYATGVSGVTYVLPLDPEQDHTLSYGIVTTPPVMTGPMAGTVSSADYIALLDPLGVEFFQKRGLATDVPATYASDLGIVVMPNTPPDQLNAFNMSNSFQTPLWSTVLSTPSATFYPALYYRAFFYIVRGTSILKLVATTGVQVDVWPIPCGINSSIKVKTVTFGSDENGPLDAFLAYGYSSTSPPLPTFQLCRFSHNNQGQMSWASPVTLDGAVTVDDIFGVNGVLLLSGSVGGNTYFTKAINASTGALMYTVTRQGADVRSYPVSVPMPTPSTCRIGLVVQQLNRSIFAYCVENPYEPLWIQKAAQCYHQAVVFSPFQILCNMYDAALVLINIIDGSIALMDTTIRPAYAATVTMENGGTTKIAWVTTTHAVLSGFSLGPINGGANDGDKGGMGAGYVVLIIIVVLSAVGAAGYFLWKRRAGGDSVRYSQVN